MSDPAQAADDLVAKAEKKLKGGMFGNMFGSKKEEAVDILDEAANKYKQVPSCEWFTFPINSCNVLKIGVCCRQRNGRSVGIRTRDAETFSWSLAINLRRARASRLLSRSDSKTNTTTNQSSSSSGG